MTGGVAISAFMVVAMFVVLACGMDEEPVSQSTKGAPVSQVDIRAGVVAPDLVGTWVSEITRNEDWEPKTRTVGHYSDMAYAVEGMTEVYVLESDGSFQRTVTNPDYGDGRVCESIRWGVWKATGNEIRFETRKTKLTLGGEVIGEYDPEFVENAPPEYGLEPVVYPVMIFLLADDRTTFVFDSTVSSYRDGLDIIFRRQPLED